MNARAGALAALLLLRAVPLAAADNACRALGSVCDGGGSPSSNTVPLAGRTWRHVFATAQPGGVGVAAAGAWRHGAGFLRAVDLLRCWLDTDGDGLPDELDTDNDGDGLADGDEVAGSAFDPVTPTAVNAADSDGDGTPDGDEAAAGTDPGDRRADFRILALTRQSGDTHITWRGRGDRTYRLLATEHLSAPSGFEERRATNVIGGAPPWYLTTNNLTDACAKPIQFYRIAIDPEPPE